MKFNQIQQTYLIEKKKLYHDKKGKQLKNSLLNLSDLNQINDLVNTFELNIKNLSKENILQVGYCGKDFFNNYRSDNIKPIDFNESWIQKDELKSIILNKGSYLPILMFFDEDECISAIECVHTKYTLKCIEELFKENKLQNEKFLFIVKPTENIEIEMTKFILPRTLYEQVGHLLIPNCNDYNEHYVLLETNNSLDIWLLFKLYHKEASYYIAKYMKSFFESNIYPSNFLFKRGD